MQIASKEKENFSLLGKWRNNKTTDDKSSIELVFYTNNNVIIRLNPGNDFHFSYSIENKFDYSILRFVIEETGKSCFSVFLFKIADEHKLEVQKIDNDTIAEWNNNESEMNTGILQRIKA